MTVSVSLVGETWGTGEEALTKGLFQSGLSGILFPKKVNILHHRDTTNLKQNLHLLFYRTRKHMTLTAVLFSIRTLETSGESLCR